MSYGEPVAVVAVTRGSGEPLASFLDSLREATTEPLDVVVAHYGEPDQAVADASAGRDARFLEAGAVAYGRAANLGVRETTARFVVVADPDVVWEPGSLDRLLAAADRWPQGATFGPLIHTKQGSVLPSARSVPSLSSGIGHALFGRVWPGNPWSGAYRHERETPAERSTGWLADTCLLVRRDAFDAIGGFDDARLVYLEDLDLGERFVKAGWHNVYVPSAVVRGSSRQNSAVDRSRLEADRHQSVWRYVSRRYSGWRWFPLRLVLRIGLGIRSVFVRVFSRRGRQA